MIPQICLICHFKMFGLPPLHVQKDLLKIIFGLVNQFSIFMLHFKTSRLQKDDMVIFFI